MKMDVVSLMSALRRKAFNSYSHLPPILKVPASTMAGWVPPGIRFGKAFTRTLEDIKRSEFAPAEELEALQRQRLCSILCHAAKTVPHYRNGLEKLDLGMDDITADPVAVLGQMPLIDKSEILEDKKAFISSAGSGIPHDYTATGGTSGEPFHFYFNSDRSAKEWAFFTDQWGRVGFDLSSRRATFRGSKIHGLYEDDGVSRERKFSSFNLTPEYLASIWEPLSRFAPDFIYAYPSTAMALCAFMEEGTHTLPPSVKALLLGSENIYPGQREYMERVTGKRVFLWYGHSEKLILAGECETSSLYHAYPQYGYAEFLTPEGQPAKPGEFCEIVGTGFMNTVMPFIRYRTGDFCIYEGDRCPDCGRAYPVFSRVKGRWTQETLVGRQNNPIAMSAVNLHSRNMHHIRQFQFFQETPGKAILKVIPGPGYETDHGQWLQAEFNAKLEGAMEISLETVDRIRLTGAGKYKFIDQHFTGANAPAIPARQDSAPCSN